MKSNIDLRFFPLLKFYFIGMFFSNILPGSTGGDFFRMYYAYKHGGDFTHATSSVITERVVGLVAMFGIGTLILPFIQIQHAFVDYLRILLPVLFTAGLIIIVLLGYSRSFKIILWCLKWLDRVRGGKVLLDILKVMHASVKQPGLVSLLFILSVALQLVEIVVFFVLGIGMGVSVEFTTYLLMVPIIFIASAIPITVGGLGVRESTAVSVFTIAGMMQGDAFAISLLFIPVLLLSSSPGLYYFVAMKSKQGLSFEMAKSEKPG